MNRIFKRGIPTIGRAAGVCNHVRNWATLQSDPAAVDITAMNINVPAHLCRIRAFHVSGGK